MIKNIIKYQQKRPGNMQLELESRCPVSPPDEANPGNESDSFDFSISEERKSEEPILFDPSSFPDDPFDYVALARIGLPKASGQPAVVAIIGAGASGLVAGMELLKAGHYPVIFEASERIGGRLFTVREFEDPLVFAEMGSMRVPPVHRTLMYYLNLFGIKTRRFPNPNQTKTCYFVNGKKEYGSPGQQVPWVAHLYQKWDDAIRPFALQMQKVWHDPELKSREWKRITEEFAGVTFREFLVQQKWTLDEIELFSTVGFGVGGYGPLYPISFIEILRINICRWDDDQMEIVGGNDRLAFGFYEQRVMIEEEEFKSLKDLGLVMTKTAVSGIGKDDSSNRLILNTVHGDTFVADAVIITAQARAVQMEMKIRKDLLTRKQWQAIYNTHFMSSAKIFLETDSAFWKSPDSGITTTISDLPIRGTYFFDFEGTDSGLICASYTWEDDSRKWHASTIEERAEKAIDMLEEIYGKGSIRPHVVSAYGFSWEEMPGYRGAFKQFYAGQQHYYHALAEPSNNIWFAGDAVSYAGGWIEGALQSGLRVARDIANTFI
jgi:lysine 2-monooxygenase